ncbi:MAG: cupin domain-containing protein [Microthrixaceae bacterium]
MAIPTAGTPDLSAPLVAAGGGDTPVSRREFHPGAPRLNHLCDQDGAGPDEPLGSAPRHLPALVAPEHSIDPDRLWDDLLARSPRAPAFRMVRDGTTLPRSQLCRSAGVGHERLADLIEPNRVLEAYDNGATLVLQGLQHTDPALARWSTNLALALDQPIQVNAYVTPGSARGLDLHFDYHDVLVVQLSGTKAWRIWAPLDRTRLPQKRGEKITRPAWDELGEPLIDVTTRPGDVLVLPRGHPHAAETLDTDSCHLTIGVMSLTWQALLAQHLRERAGGPALAASATEGGDPGAALLALGDHLDPAALARLRRLEIWRRQPRTRLRPRGAALDPSQPLRVTPGPLLWLDPQGDEVALQLGDRALRFPAAASPLLAAVLTGDEGLSPQQLTGEEHGGLDADSVRAILTVLHREGVLTHGPL